MVLLTRLRGAFARLFEPVWGKVLLLAALVAFLANLGAGVVDLAPPPDTAVAPESRLLLQRGEAGS